MKKKSVDKYRAIEIRDRSITLISNSKPLTSELDDMHKSVFDSKEIQYLHSRLGHHTN